ncbi:MAG: transglycosylase SLT domain-containing protein [Alphaproteobacteria bacterium]|nr:transglycosylase SLT domain-containing protein [Alphaproteobacteria bacterium]
MVNNVNYIKNNELQALSSQAGRRVTGAIEKASARTGVDFAYLMKQAKVESSFNPSAKARSSSATGLFQFIESTWLEMVNKYGDKYGISKSGSRHQILAQRNDPEKAALMAAEFAAENRNKLQACLGNGCQVGDTELYLAHFLGAEGAVDFLQARNANPDKSGAALFPQAARANRSVFYNEAGRPRTLDEIYSRFASKLDATPSANVLTAKITQPQEQVDLAAMLNFYPGVPQYRAVANVNNWQNFYAPARMQPAMMSSNWMRNYAINPVDIMQISQMAYNDRYNA